MVREEQEQWHKRQRISFAFPCSEEERDYLSEVTVDSFMAYLYDHRIQFQKVMKVKDAEFVKKLGSVTIRQREDHVQLKVGIHTVF